MNKAPIIALGTVAAIAVLFLLSLISEALPYALGLIVVLGICFMPSRASRAAGRHGGERSIPRWYPNQGAEDRKERGL